MHQSLVIPKQNLQMVLLYLMFWSFKRGFLQFLCKNLFPLKTNIKNSAPEVHLS